MMLLRRLVLIPLAFGLGPISALALTWETTQQNVTIQPGVTQTIVEFPFKNDSASPVSLIDVKTGCDCSVPELNKDPVRPGEAGVLKVRYQSGRSPGTKHVSVVVRASDSDTPTTLRFVATVPPVVSLTPVLLRWSRADAATPKEVLIRQAGGTKVSGVKLINTPPTVVAEIKAGEEPSTWILSIAPVAMDASLTARVEIEADVEGRPVTYAAYAVVR